MGRAPNSFGISYNSVGPVAAGLQTYVVVVGAITAVTGLSPGLVGNWIRENWLEATRVFWDTVLDRFEAFQISNNEKDALTAIAFFLPLALSSLFSAVSARGHPNHQENKDVSWITSYGTRVTGFALAFLLLILISKQVVDDALLVFASATPDWRLLRSISLISFGIMLLYAALISALYVRHVGDFGKAWRWLGTSAGLIHLVLFIIPISASLILAFERLGPIRTSAVFVVFSSIMLTAIVRPRRIFVIILVIGIMLSISFGYELFNQIKETVDSNPLSPAQLDQ